MFAGELVIDGFQSTDDVHFRPVDGSVWTQKVRAIAGHRPEDRRVAMASTPVLQSVVPQVPLMSSFHPSSGELT